MDTNEFEIMPEHSPVKDSKANEQIENGVRRAEEQCRAIRMSFEQRLDAAIPILHPIHLWLVKHASDVYTKFRNWDRRHDTVQAPKGRRMLGRTLGVWRDSFMEELHSSKGEKE